MRAFRLPLSLFVSVRVATPVVAAILLGVHAAPVAAQLVVEPQAERAPCPNEGNPPDDKRPCAESGSTAAIPAGGAAGPGSGGGGGGGSGGAAASATMGPYRIVKVMNLGGEMVDGVVCGIDQAFVVRMQTRPATFDIKFEPADKAHGMWTYAYDIPRAGESHKASGDYTMSPPAADGSRSLTIDGKDFVTFKGFAGPMPMHYVFGLAPLAAGSGCR
ncbi:MAG TPA: hypothetical protein VMV37_06065 [Gammaproteobacteria bacterium]|nr:hypothetical protein [Gammaproteobacteria bacterium]